jgi:arylsulfatase A-like enzyme
MLFQPLRIFHTAFISGLILWAYLWFFYQSANTPLRDAGVEALLPAAAWGLTVVALYALTVTLLLTAVIVAIRHANAATWASRFIETPIIFVTALLIIENWCYSVFGWGLKSGDGSWLKILFLALSAFMTYHGLSAITTASVWLAKRGVVPAVVIVMLSFTAGLFTLSSGASVKQAPLVVGKDPLPHILMISSDGVSADLMSLYGYEQPSTPFLTSLADELMIFDAAYTNNANTTGSITATLNGISPATTRVIYPPDFLADQFATLHLPRLLGELGYYRSQWSVPHYASAPSQGMTQAFDRINGVDQQVTLPLFTALPLTNLSRWLVSKAVEDGRGVVLDVLSIKEMTNPYSQVATAEGPVLPKKLSDHERLAGLNEDIDTALALGRPLFAQVHLMDTHGLKFYPSKRQFSAGMVQTDFWMTPFYLDSLLEFDQRLSAIYANLKRRQILDKTLIVIFSDHAQKWKTHLRVPLLIRTPHASKTGRFSTNVQLLDIAPTIVEWLGATPPNWMQGESLLNPPDIATDRMLVVSGFDAEVSSTGNGQGWQRAETTGRPFSERNEFRIIHCNASAEALFPELALVFTTLPGNPTANDCDRGAEKQRIQNAQVKLNALLQNTD